MATDGGIVDFLKEKVPDLAVAVGDTMTNGAVSRIADALGINVSGEEDLKARLQGSPELMAKLKKNERRLALKELRAKLEDRKDAREMAVERQDPDVDRLAYVAVGGFFVLTTAVITVAILPGVTVSPEVMSVAATLIGMASQHASQVMGFYFGSSTGSKSKDQALAQQVRALSATSKS